MKKVLIITYYWPPAGGAGVQRWLKFVKYLREFGWEPIIYTPENSEIPEKDNSLLKDIPENLIVLRQPIWEPYNIYKLLTFSRNKRINVGFLSENKKPKLSEKLSVWIRSNFFIPDARCFWIKPSVRFLFNYLQKNPVDALISTGPPHSMHMIALKLINKFRVHSSEFIVPKWIADFRDPWTNIDFYKELKLTASADRKHHRLEKEVLMNADKVITVGRIIADEFNVIYERRYDVITNGYDEDDVANVAFEPDKKFSIAHIGVMPKSRNPHNLWRALRDLSLSNEAFAADLEIKLVGKIDISIKDDISANKLDVYVRKLDYLPHDEVVKVQKQSQILLLVINQTENAKGILTGKFFEYLAAKRPVICIGPVDGEIAQIINETKSGKVIDYDDTAQMKQTILDYYNESKSGKLISHSINIEKYSRKQLTKDLVEILNS